MDVIFMIIFFKKMRQKKQNYLVVCRVFTENRSAADHHREQTSVSEKRITVGQF